MDEDNEGNFAEGYALVGIDGVGEFKPFVIPVIGIGMEFVAWIGGQNEDSGVDFEDLVVRDDIEMRFISVGGTDDNVKPVQVRGGGL